MVPQLEPLFLETNDPSPLSLVLQLESLFLETNDLSPPLPGSQLELLFLETDDPSHSLPGSQLELLFLETKDPSHSLPGSQLELFFLETKDPHHHRFPSRNEEALRSSLGLNVFPVMSQKYPRDVLVIQVSMICNCVMKKFTLPDLYSRNILPGDK